MAYDEQCVLLEQALVSQMAESRFERARFRRERERERERERGGETKRRREGEKGEKGGERVTQAEGGAAPPPWWPRSSGRLRRPGGLVAGHILKGNTDDENC